MAYKHYIAAGAMMLALSANAQSELWITGSAVPGGVQKLEKRQDNTFKFAGSLNRGILKIITTEEIGKSTQYLSPRLEDAYIVNNGEGYTTTSDSTRRGWVVPFQEDFFRFTVDPSQNTLTGELFVPWKEMFIAGGAVECGWNSFQMLEMTQDDNDPCVWTWTGELRNRTENEEPKRFKLLGQDNWDPKSLHPYVQDESALKSTQLKTGGADNKWSIEDDGIYRITVNVFRETFKAEYLGNNSRPSVTNVESAATGGISITTDGRSLHAKCGARMKVEIFSPDGTVLAKASGKTVSHDFTTPGVYIVKASTKHNTVSRKVVIK